jgi:serine protease Do
MNMYENNDNNRYSYASYNDTTNSAPHMTQHPEVIPSAPRKERKAPKIIAAVLGMALVAGTAGGGAAWYVVRNYQSVAPVAAAPSTPIVQPTVVSGTTTDVSGVVKAVSGSVVEITISTPGNPFTNRQGMQGAGSGVIVSEDGYIVTNNHVVESAQIFTVRTKDGAEYEATLIGTDEATDLAVLKVDATGLTPATYADSDAIEVGALSIVIGNPTGQLGGSVTSGIISAASRELTIGDDSMTLIQTSAAVNPGNSGGGLFDANGSLVGVVNAKLVGQELEGLGFAIPSNTVKTVVADLIENGYVTGRPQLGITVLEMNDPYTMAQFRIETPGLYIASDENPTGLQPGDRITKVGDKEIATSDDLSAVLEQHKVGDVLSVTVVHFGEDEETTVQVTLTEKLPASQQPSLPA